MGELASEAQRGRSARDDGQVSILRSTFDILHFGFRGSTETEMSNGE
jgi:hypothetical protein